VGNKIKNCLAGIGAVEALNDCKVIKRSRFYINEPVGFEEQDWFVNAAINIETGLKPHALLDSLQAIQIECGCHRKAVRFGPRCLDLDIILIDGVILNTPRLTVPHPRMHDRRFVLQPICDIDPDNIHPVLKKDMATLLKCLDGDGQRMIAF